MVKELTLVAVGDICFGMEEYPSIDGLVPMSKGKVDLDARFRNVSTMFQQADYAMGNCEGAICNPLLDAEGKASWGAVIRMVPEAADTLKKVGFNALTLASNHTMDLGAEGMLQTLSNLDRVSMAHAGGGRNIHEARKPAILERGGVRLALLSYSSVFVPGTFPAGENKPGIAKVTVSTSYVIPDNVAYSPGVLPRIVTIPDHKDMEQMLEDIRQAKAQADIVVVSPHWGVSRFANSRATGCPMEDSPSFVVNYQEDMGRAAIDAGADLVIGHHPHRLQGMELYQGKLICYSLGQLTFGYRYVSPNFGEESVIVKGYIDPSSKQLTRVSLLPMMVPAETQEPYIVPIDEAGDIIAEYGRLSKKYGTKFRVEGEEVVIQEA